MAHEQPVEEGTGSEDLGIWRHYTVRDGLPDMKIECVFEDSRGLLWIGTHDRGVVAYDGDEFRRYSRREGLAGNGVFSVLEDNGGDLWFGTNEGLSRYDGHAFKTIEAGEPCSYLWGRCVDSAGRLWFGIERRPGRPPAVARWDGRRLELVSLANEARPQGQSIHQVVVDRNGVVWCGGHGMYSIPSDDRIVATECPGSVDQINCLAPDHRGRLLVGSDTGVHATDGRSFEVVGAVDAWLVALAPDHDQSLWLATHDGQLLHMRGDEVHVVGAVEANFWRGLCRDHRGRLWVSTYGMGLYCYDATRFRVFRTAQGLPDNHVQCLAVDGSGAVWVGTGRGLAVHTQGGVSIPGWSRQLPEGTGVTSVLADHRGRLWLGTRVGHLWKHDVGVEEVAAGTPEMEGYRIGCLAEDRRGRVWFASPHGRVLGFCDATGVRYLAAGEYPACPTRVGAIAVDRSGTVWFGAAHAASAPGLSWYDGEGFAAGDGGPEPPVTALCAGKDGALWVGTNEGVARHDSAGVYWFTTQSGLSCDITTALAQSEDGVVWIGTEGGGVCCLDGRVVQTIELPGVAEGRVVRAIAEDLDGNLWFGTEAGLVRYARQRATPTVSIVEVSADQSHPQPREVQISAAATQLLFRFRGRSPVEDASNLVYSYRLEGYDTGWRQTRRGAAEYPGLKPGEYRFTVQSVDRDLNYSTPAEVVVRVAEDARIAALHEELSAVGADGIIRRSDAMASVVRQLNRVARADATVLVLGETGTGKGLVARAIHELSRRAGRPFIQVNCGAMDDALAASELFGHERGGYTGATARRMGKFEKAHGGTLFLDEVGDLPLGSQARLLHVLQERYVERIGGSQPISVDVRVIAATNRDLTGAVARGAFRQDLYYRLNVFPIHVPPLRERRDDVSLLAESFLRQMAQHLDRKVARIGEDAMRALVGYEWPGNVRELEHLMQWAALTVDGDEIRLTDIAQRLGERTAKEALAPAVSTLDEHERRYIVEVLEQTGWVINGRDGAAAVLGVNPSTLRSRMARLGILRPKHGPDRR